MTKEPNLLAQRTSLACFHPTKLDRFGGRYMVVFGGLYRVARECVVSLLNGWGDVQDNRSDEELFTAALRHLAPGHALAIAIGVLFTLQPFRDGSEPKPFDPVGPDARKYAVQCHQMATRLLDYALFEHKQRGVTR